jgi:hypothetical protein
VNKCQSQNIQAGYLSLSAKTKSAFNFDKRTPTTFVKVQVYLPPRSHAKKA